MWSEFEKDERLGRDSQIKFANPKIFFSPVLQVLQDIPGSQLWSDIQTFFMMPRFSAFLYTSVTQLTLPRLPSNAAHVDFEEPFDDSLFSRHNPRVVQFIQFNIKRGMNI